MQVQGDEASDATPPVDKFERVVGRVERVAGAATKAAVAVMAVATAAALAVAFITGDVTAIEALEAIPF